MTALRRGSEGFRGDREAKETLYPKCEKYIRNSFSRGLRCNIDDISVIHIDLAISIQTVPFENNHTSDLC